MNLRSTASFAMLAAALGASFGEALRHDRETGGNRGYGSARPYGRTNGGKTPRPLQRRRMTGSQRARKRGRK